MYAEIKETLSYSVHVAYIVRVINIEIVGCMRTFKAMDDFV